MMHNIAREVEREIKIRGGMTGRNRPIHGLEIAALKSLIDQAISALSILRDDRTNSTPDTRKSNGNGALAQVDSPFLISDSEFWESNEGMTNERQFHSKVYYLVNRLSMGYRSDDLDMISDGFQRLLWVADKLSSDPWLSIYDTGLVLGLLNIAHACADRFIIEDAYQIAEHCYTVLRAKHDRRARSGLAPRPDSECWYRLYELVAELKWKGYADSVERLWGPEEIIEGYEVVESRCLNYIRQNPSPDPTRDERVRSALAWSRVQIIKMSMRWARDCTARLIDEFNQIHDQELTLAIGEFLDGPGGKHRSPWYWDLELFKWCVIGSGTPDEAFLCHQWRLDAMRSTPSGECQLAAYTQATALELDFLLGLEHDSTGKGADHGS